MSEKRKYSTNKDYKSIAIRFNLKDKEEKKLFVFLNSMNSEDRTTFIYELYNKKGSVVRDLKNLEMTIYEKKLFDLVEKVIVGSDMEKAGIKLNNISNLKKNPIKSNEIASGIKSNIVDYDKISINDSKNENEDIKNLVDSFIDDGIKE